MATNSQYDQLFEDAGKQQNVDPRLLKTIFQIESSSNPNTQDSNAGAQGGMQLMPDTAKMLGVTDPHDLTQAIPAAAKYVAQGLDATGSPEGALGYYFAGPDKAGWQAKTAAYIQKGKSLYPSIQIAKNQPQSNIQDYTKSGGQLLDQITSGKAQADSSSSNSPYAAAGAKLLDGIISGQATDTGSSNPMASQGGAILDQITKDVPSQPVQQINQTVPPGDGSQQFAAGVGRGLRDVGDITSPYLAAGVNKLSQLPGVSWLDKQFPSLGQLDQQYSTTDTAKVDADRQAFETKYGNSALASAGRFVGQTLPTIPITGGIGAFGKAVGATVSNPLLAAGAKIATGTAQGAAGAGMTGGDTQTGALAGGVLGAAGPIVGGLSSTLGSGGMVSRALQSKMADALVSVAIGGGLGYSLGGDATTSILSGLAAGSMGSRLPDLMKIIVEKHGSAVAAKVAQYIQSANNSGILSGTAGAAAGTYGNKLVPYAPGNH